MTFWSKLLYFSLVILSILLLSTHIASYVMPTLSDDELLLLKHLMVGTFFSGIVLVMVLTRIKMQHIASSHTNMLCVLETILTATCFTCVVYMIIYTRQIWDSKLEQGLHFMRGNNGRWLTCSQHDFITASWLNIRIFSILSWLFTLMSLMVVIRKHLGVFSNKKHKSI